MGSTGTLTSAIGAVRPAMTSWAIRSRTTPNVRVTLPTMGWVARNANSGACSFPLPDGTCGDANRGDCQRIGLMADPTLTSSPSNVDSIVRWVKQLRKRAGPVFGSSPSITSPGPVGQHPLRRPSKVHDLRRDVDPVSRVRDRRQGSRTNAGARGPGRLGMERLLESPAGIADRVKHDNLPFLQWFLRQVKVNDDKLGKRTLDILDVHYAPAAISSSVTDARAAEVRLRSTRSLWDRRYVDESAIREPVYLIPRMPES